MSRILIVVIVLILLLACLPVWPYAAGWGAYPAGGLGLVLIVVIVLALLEKI